MKTNKKVILILLICLIVALTTAFVGCDEKQEEGIRYNDKVEGRYSDGMRIVDTYEAPATAVEFKEESRVEKVMYVDNRVKGLHFTGLYLPAGETIVVQIAPTIISQNHKLIINSDQPDERIIELKSIKTIETVEKGSRIDIWVDNSITEYNAFEINLKGCVEMPYYRLGVDKHKIEETTGFAVLDCANARFLLPAQMLNEIEDIDNTLRWWRSAIEIMNRITEVGFESGDLAPINVYVGDEYSKNSWNIKDKFITVKTEDFRDMVDYDKLANGSGEILIDLLGELIAQRADGYAVGMLKDDFGKVIADISYITMTNNVKTPNRPNLANASEYLKDVKEYTCTDSKAQIFFNTILHSFGIEKTIAIIQQYKYAMKSKELTNMEEYIVKVSQILGYDLSAFCKHLGFEMSEASKNETKDLPLFIPVQSSLTTGGVANNVQTGIVVPFGQKTELDFNKAIVALEGEWKIKELKGSSSWEHVENGKYNYLPNESRLKDDFSIIVSDGTKDVELFGHVTCDIKVSSYSVYQNTPFKTIDSAIKGVKEQTPTKAFSVDKAQVVPEEDSNENVYSFAVTKGSVQVKEDGKYTFYLKSKGLVKVKFGVSAYMQDMFSNQLTVTDYTEELKAEVELKSSKVYNFEIYVLSTQGGGWATLGIKDENGKIVDVDENYIVYQDMERSSIVEYKAPVLDIDSFKVQQKGYEHYLTKTWKLKDGPASDKSKEELLFDNKKTTYYEVGYDSNSFTLVVDMMQGYKVEYLELSNRVNMIGVDIKVEYSNDNDEYTELFIDKIKDVDNIYIFKDSHINCRYIKITLTKSTKFNCAISEIDLGRIMKESIIIPNTSTKISYQGEWHEVNNYASVNGSITVNNDKNSTIEYEFYGSMINVYSTKDVDFGMMKVYIDNKEVEVVNLYSKTAQCATKVFSKEFADLGLHKIRLVPQSKGDVINIDYLTSIEEQRPQAETNKFNYWYILIIPGVLIVALIGCLIADIVSKKNRNKHEEVKEENKSDTKEE